MNEKNSVLENQLTTALQNIDNKYLHNIVIAYEPVWAIGTGLTPHSSEIESTIGFIKSSLKAKYNIDFKVLYGGSVNTDNVCEFKKISNIDGFLIGGASLDANDFKKLINA